MRAMRMVLAAVLLLASPRIWIVQTSGIDTNLRGVSVASFHAADGSARSVVWASGSNGVILRSPSTQAPWVQSHVSGAETLDFRGIQAFDDKNAYVMSSGEGDKSRILRWRAELDSAIYRRPSNILSRCSGLRYTLTLPGAERSGR